ncbi:MAG TPA: hypothetical protein VJA45_05620 [Methylomirabilota bacterium]|nr:hypothetical protein [Methylomirabilota bacterium]
MELRKLFVKRAAVWLILGLLGGGLAGYWWEHQRAALDVADLRVRHADEQKAVEATSKQLREELKAERQRREALEQVLSKGRK